MSLAMTTLHIGRAMSMIAHREFVHCIPLQWNRSCVLRSPSWSWSHRYHQCFFFSPGIFLARGGVACLHAFIDFTCYVLSLLMTGFYVWLKLVSFGTFLGVGRLFVYVYMYIYIYFYASSSSVSSFSSLLFSSLPPPSPSSFSSSVCFW